MQTHNGYIGESKPEAEGAPLRNDMEEYPVCCIHCSSEMHNTMMVNLMDNNALASLLTKSTGIEVRICF